MTDEQAMQAALVQARAAADIGEVPVGAVVLYGGEIIAACGNDRETSRDPLGHAEILAIRAAAAHLDRWRLTGATLVVTLEPCPMCAGAIVNSRVDKVVFGASDPRAGAAGSIMNILADTRLNHRPEVTAGVLAEDCAGLLRQFFAHRRQMRRPSV